MKVKSVINTLWHYHQPRVFFLLTLGVSLMSICTLSSYFERQGYTILSIIGIYCFALFKTELFVVFQSLSKRKILKVIFRAIWGIYVVLSVVNFICVEFYSFGISRRLVLVFMQTNSREIQGFMPGFVNNLTALIFSPKLLYTLIVCVFVLYIIQRLRNYLFNLIGLIGSVFGVVYAGWFIGEFDYNRMSHLIIPNLILSVKSVVKDEREFRRNVAFIRELPNSETARTDTLAQNLLLIIGESASSEHHAIYGYQLPTTPNMERLKDSLAIFTDALAACASTAESVPKILTYQPDRRTEESWFYYPSVFQLFRKVGYMTYWLSNQDRTGVAGGTYSVIASSADIVKYIGTENVNDHLNAKYDEELLPEIRRALANSLAPNLIVVHLFGSHTPYHDRYSPTRAKFSSYDVLQFNRKPWVNHKAAKLIAEYDNSIAYTDSILGEIIGLVSYNPEPSIVIYVADHGENVYDDRNFVGRDINFVKVPLIIYMNSAYRKQNPTIVDVVSRSVGQPVAISSLIYAIQTLTGTDYKFYDATEDFLSPRFIPRVRYSNDEPWPEDIAKMRPK